jgi:uncharacterized protein YjiS (DUF1127 family)
MVLVVGRERVMANRVQGRRVMGLMQGAGRIDAPIKHLARAAGVGCAAFWTEIAPWLRRWRETRDTWAALRDLDDRQLKEFRIAARPPELTRRQFPDIG